MKKVLSLLSALTLLFNTFSFVLVSPVKAVSETIITDDQAIYAGTWTDYPNQGHLDTGVHYPTTADAGQTATWNFSSITPGYYEVYTSWSTHINRATSVPYTLNNVGGSSGFTVNQEQLADQVTTGGNGEWSGWYHVGNFNLNTSSNLVLTSVDNPTLDPASNSDYVIADEVKLALLDESPSSPVLTWPLGGIHINDDTPLMQWENSTDDFGVVNYDYRIFYNCSNALDIPGSCTGQYTHPAPIPVSELQAGTTSQGTYYWQVRAVDAVGNASDWSELGEFTIDTHSPTISLDTPLTDSFHRGVINLQASCDETCDYINFWWRAEGESFDPASNRYHYVTENGTNFEWDLDSLNAQKWDGSTYVLEDGDYYFYAAGKDLAGNWARTPDLKITVDNTSPTADLVFPVPGPASTSFQVVFSEDVLEADAENPLNYFLNNWPGAGGSGDLAGDAVITYDSPSKTATILFTNPGWYISPEQEWGVQNIHDLAGNLLSPNPTTETSTPMIDPILLGIPETIPNPTNSTSQDWTWLAATDDGGSGVKGYYSQVQVSGDPADPLGVWDWLGNTVGTTTNLGEGFWQLFLKAEDRAGNQSEIVGSNELIVDITRPESSVGILSEFYNSLPISVPFTASDNVGLDRVRLYKRLLGELTWDYHTYENVSGTSAVSNFNIGTLPEGVWELATSAVDSADNIEELPELADAIFTFDETDPTVAWTSPLDGDTVSGMVPLIVSATDSGSGVKNVEFFVDGSSIGVDSDDSDGWGLPWDTNILPLGTYELKAVATDNADNSSENVIHVGVAAIISNVQGVGFDTDEARVTWTTDRPTSSRVVYQPAPHPEFGGPPDYGYAYSTPTFDSVVKVTEHTVYISGLSAGTEYAFRVISEGSPIAISGGYSFQTLSNSGAPIAGGGPVATTAVLGTTAESTTGFNRYAPNIIDEGGIDEPENTEEVLGDEAEATPTPAPGEVEAESDGLFASNSMMRILRWVGILIGLLVLFYFLWGFFRRKNKKQ